MDQLLPRGYIRSIYDCYADFTRPGPHGKSPVAEWSLNVNGTEAEEAAKRVNEHIREVVRETEVKGPTIV